jgi:SAM-dependent methyltransferase
MPGFFTPRRRHDPELMDQPGLGPDEVAGAYHVLGRVNRHLGNLRALRRELRRFLDEETPAFPVTLLDAGSGSGDLPRALSDDLRRRAGLPGARAVALDLDPTALGLALRNKLAAVRANGLRLPFADQSFDLVTAVKFAHHFHGPALSRLLAELSRVARRRVIVLDIRRSWLAYAGFLAWSRVFTANRLVRQDGLLSVLRGFTREELEALAAPLAGFRWDVRAHAPFQLALVGTRQAR